MIILQQTRGLLSSNDGLSLDLPFAETKSLTARIGPTPVFTRSSSATYVDLDGLIKTAAIDAPRFEHDPITGECFGLMVEETRTNLILRSTEFDISTYWSPIRLVAQPTANTDTAPDGSTTAEKLIPSITSGDHRIDRSSVTVVSGQLYTISVFVKASGYSGFSISAGSSPSPIGATFSLSEDGSVVSTQSGWSATITKFLDGWFRCTATFTTAATTVRVYFGVGQSGTTFSYSGDGTSGILIWGAQLEAGSSATSFIKTSTSTLARSIDLCTITGTDFSSFYNNNEGTAFVDSASIILSTTADNTVYGLGTSSTSAIRLYNRSTQGNRLSASVADFGILTPSSNYNSNKVFYKSAISCNSSGFDYFIDGTQIPDSSTGSTLTADSLTFSNVTASRSNNTIKSFKYFRRRFPIAKLESITL